MNAKIFEIFSSIQGEGPYTGVNQIFVRFFECHMHCVWCDTPDSIGDGKREYKEYSLEQLMQEVKPFIADSHSVSLTGGEPLLQADFIKAFIPYIREAGLKVYLETSGVLHQPLRSLIEDVDIISMDFKLPSSTQCRSFWKEHEEFLKIASTREVFVKAVIASQTDFEDLKTAVAIIEKVNPATSFILQPNTFDLARGVSKKCLEFQEYCLQYLPNVRVMPQMHKFLNMR